MKLSQLVYVSDACEAMTQDAIELIMKRCRRNNGERNITGLLLYSGGHFIQLLEGHQPVLANLFATIRADARHHNVQQLYFEPAAVRLFPDWRMGLLNLDTIGALDRSRLQSFIERLKKPYQGAGILGLLREFRDQLPATDGARDQAA